MPCFLRINPLKTNIIDNQYITVKSIDARQEEKALYLFGDVLTDALMQLSYDRDLWLFLCR
ncbi:MAG: hypothetical protein JW855_02585 [Gammaproteobacteria bacterium]|nr:hypothetical protein [Gammaproteobacteria bacterium]